LDANIGAFSDAKTAIPALFFITADFIVLARILRIHGDEGLGSARIGLGRPYDR